VTRAAAHGERIARGTATRISASFRKEVHMESFQFRDRAAERLALGLGWFSLALGVAEVAAPRSVARLSGVRDDDTTASLLRYLGAREIAHGISILSQPDRARWLWSRVAGDAIDLSVVGSAIAMDRADPARAAAASAALVGVAILDILAAQRVGRSGASRGVRVEHTITINRPIEEVYQFWRNFENFPRFMRHLESVQTIDDRRSRWQAKGPAGLRVEWDAEMVQEVEYAWIAWRSLPGSEVENHGSVRFARAPGARGTELRVQLEYLPPAGALGWSVARIFGEEPDQQIREDLRRFKQLMETGEIPVSEGPGLWRPAQPPARPDLRESSVEVQR
jgi:uncharacterized membrane protein